MKHSILMAVVAGLALVAGRAADAPQLTDEKAKVSYGIGMNLGTQFRNDELDIDTDLLLRGVQDSLKGNKTLLSESEMQAALQDMMTKTRAKRTEKRRALGEKNKTDGEKFLADNKAKPGVVALPSGLQYKVVTEGKGDSPKATDNVTVQYRGTLLDGTEFDSSYSRNEPATFQLNRVIKGWTEGVQLMKPGAKYQFYIPGDLAYGPSGYGAKIGPNATLVFDIELLSSKPVEAPPTPPAAAGQQAVTSDIIKVPSKEEMDKGAKVEVLKKEDVDKLLKEQQAKKDAEKK